MSPIGTAVAERLAMAFRRPDPSFVLVTALVACLVAGLTVLLVDLALKRGAFEPTYPEFGRLACKGGASNKAAGRLASCN